MELRHVPSNPEAAVAAITGDQTCVETTRAAYEKRRDVLCDGLNAIGWKIPKPEATMFVWAPVPESFTSSEEFAVELVKKSGVLGYTGQRDSDHPEKVMCAWHSCRMSRS